MVFSAQKGFGQMYSLYHILSISEAWSCGLGLNDRINTVLSDWRSGVFRQSRERFIQRLNIMESILPDYKQTIQVEHQQPRSPEIP